MPPYASSGMITWSPGASSAQHRVLGGHAAREREAVRARPRATRGTPRARARVGLPLRRVLVARVLADRLLRERRRRGDRRHHRAGRRVGRPGPRGWRGSRSPSPSVVPVTRAPASARNVEHVGAGEHADRVAAVEHEHRGCTCSSRSTTSATGLADPDHRQRRLHHLADRPVEHRRVAERLVHERQLVEHRRYTSFAASGGSVVVGDHELRHAELAHAARTRRAPASSGVIDARGRGSSRPSPRARRPRSGPRMRRKPKPIIQSSSKIFDR